MLITAQDDIFQIVVHLGLELLVRMAWDYLFNLFDFGMVTAFNRVKTLYLEASQFSSIRSERDDINIVGILIK